MDNKFTVVIGAGPAGLAAAFKLCKHGKKVALLEKEALPGGMSATLSRGPIRYDLGPHAFYHISREVRDILDIVLAESPLTCKSRVASFFLKGRHVSYPLNILEQITSRNFSMKDAFLALSGYASARIKNIFVRNQPLTLQDFGYSVFGKYLYSMTLDKIYKKTWGIPTSLLSPCLGEHPSSKMNLIKLLSAAMRIKYDSYAALHNKFFYHPDGIGEPFLRLGSAIQRMCCRAARSIALYFKKTASVNLSGSITLYRRSH
jgi:protoporphyrinogen oxidase